MNEAWLAAVPSILVAAAVLIAPGAVVVAAGWGLRSLAAWMFAPAISISLAAVAATAASLVGLRWSLLPLAILTVVAAAVAFLVRRRSRPPAAPSQTGRAWMAPVAAVAGLGGAAVAIALQLMTAFGAPENISQTFDNVVHLSAIRLALDTGDASVFGIGRTSDVPFYPNGWHSIVTLTAQLGGGGIPLAVNAANIAICAIAWPASMLALAAVAFRARPAALLVTGALSTGFGAFPLLLLDFGVLYPNATAYAILPAGLAALWMVLQGPDRVRSSLLVLVLCAGIGLAHPNAFLAFYALAVGVVVVELLRGAWRARTRRAWLGFAGTGAVLLILGVVLWRVGRTNTEMSAWGAWQSTAQAVGEAALVSPRGYPITVATAVLLVVGMLAIARDPARWLRVAIPFAAGALLFVTVSGLPFGTRIRDILTNPWYNDSYRLAALLPMVGIPVAVVGALALIDGTTVLWRRAGWREPVRLPLVALAALSLFGVAAGANVTAVMAHAQANYRIDDSAALLTDDELALIERLDDTTPDDAVLIVNPWTGGSLAYPLAGREVLERHIFSARTDDEDYVNRNLKDIDTDPEVCEAVARLGADYVLDFGSQNVFNDKASGLERTGLNDLSPSPHLVVVDEEGDDARLFEIVGCG